VNFATFAGIYTRIPFIFYGYVDCNSGFLLDQISSCNFIVCKFLGYIIN